MEGGFGIGTAVAIIRAGGKVARWAWAAESFLWLTASGNGIFITTNGVTSLWKPESDDLLADDYVEVP